MHRFILFMAVCLVLIPFQLAQADITAQPQKTFNAQSFTLENGLMVVLVENHRAPVVTHMIWYKVGAADELPGLSGMAHYFEHLMFKGTDSIAPGDFSKIVRTLGGRDNAFTGQDFTAYFQSISTEHLERVMIMEADRMLNLAPPSGHFESEKKVVLEERRQRTENDPRGLFGEQIRSALFTNHPYGTPIVGWMDEIERYQWADVKKFYDRWYAPNNAMVIVSGAITMDELKPLAEKIYGPLPARDIPKRKRPHVPPAIGQTHMELSHPAIRQPALQKIFLAPSSHQNPQDSLTLQVLQEIFSGGPTTRLYQSLVVDQKLASSVSLSYRGTALDYGSLWVSAVPLDGIKLEALQSAVEIEMNRVITDGVSDQEVEDAIQRLQDSAIFARDSIKGPATIIGYALATGSTLDQVESWPQDIAKVTAQQVQDAAIKYLNPNQPWIRPAITGYMLPEAR